MAEFCKDCVKECVGLSDKELKRIVLSKDLDFCEGCGQWKPVVVKVRATFWEKVGCWLRSKVVN